MERGKEKIEINLNIRNEQIKSFIGFRPKDYYGQDGVDSWYDYLLDHVLHSGSRLWRCCLSTSSIPSERFWDSVSVERTLLDDRYQKGKEEGKEEGRAEGMSQRSLEIARNLLSLGLPIDQITQATGLTEEEIELLKES